MRQTRRRDRRLTNHLRRLLSNVPLHHIPQTGVIFLPCLPCGQRSSVPYFANGRYHSSKLVLRTAFLIIYVISTERQRVEKSRLTDRFLRACGYAALSRNDRMQFHFPCRRRISQRHICRYFTHGNAVYLTSAFPQKNFSAMYKRRRGGQ